MKPVHKMIDIQQRNSFTVPVEWKKDLRMIEGATVTFKVEKKSIIIERCYGETLEAFSTVGRRGTIYIPKEIRDHFERNDVYKFQMSILGKTLMMKPS